MEMENQYLIIETSIQALPEIEYNEQEIKEFIDYVMTKTDKLVVTRDNEREMADLGSQVKYVIDKLKTERLDKEKKVKKPIEEFINNFKNWEKQLDLRYREIRDQIDYFSQEDLKAQLEEMRKAQIEMFDFMNVPKEIRDYVKLPEQKKELARKSYTIDKAKKQIEILIQKAIDDYEVIKTLVEATNTANEITLRADLYAKYIDDIQEAKKQIEEDKNKIISVKEEIKKQEEAKAEAKIQKEIEKNLQIEKEKIREELFEKKEVEQPKNDELKLIITFNKSNKEEIIKAKMLKDFLTTNEIKYEIIK
ncbi:DUF1351 domain-containing protein [Caviibacter abscessus]|uniref:DUF1351 domain-containing protein n=1 Tax=Caviibacter abscessus TaxID=1766719 RepID=UPI000838A469|nr:DUF1351 domain-containing protein [Caviibacter abscessus]